MGLIQAVAGAAKGAAGGILAEQWKEYFYCEALPADVLVAKGCKKTSGRSVNTGGDANVITSGSLIAITDGQCMLIVEQGRVVDVCAIPGEYYYDASTELSILAGSLGSSRRSPHQQRRPAGPARAVRPETPENSARAAASPSLSP